VSYLTDLREALRGHVRERVVVIPMGGSWRYPPVLIAEGDEGSAEYDRRALIQVVRDHRCGEFVVGHGHPEPGQIFPSFGDITDCRELRDVAPPFGLRLTDFVIVSFDGRAFSFSAHSLLEDPLNAGLPFARQGLEVAARSGGDHDP
jgi:RadC-like JAB domain